jgi:hypothetical protein
VKILYTEAEGGTWKGLEISAPRPIFAICLPDGTIWDPIVGVDTYHKIGKDEFEKLSTESD